MRWAEVDAQRVVFNGHYLNYLDVAVTEFWRHVGLPYPGAWQDLGADIFVRRNVLEYHAPAVLDDRLDVAVRIGRLGNSSITLNWALSRDGRALVDGEVVYVCVDVHTNRPMSLPEAARRQLLAHDAGEDPWQLRHGDWALLGSAAAVVRRSVFIDEQGIDESEEWDDDDAQATHVVLSNLWGWPVATGRLIPGDEPGAARIGRMAVLRCARGTGLGRRVLLALMDEARAQGRLNLSLHAQCSAQPLYAAVGFQPEGEVFDEVGIPHQKMVLTLSAT